MNFLVFTSFTESSCQEVLKDITVPIHKKQLASLPVEGAGLFGIGGSYFVKGYVSLKKGINKYSIEVALNGNTPARTLGIITYSGKIKLLIDGVLYEEKNLINKNRPQLLPDDGTQHIGETEFSILAQSFKTVDIVGSAGYIISLNNGAGSAVPFPYYTEFKVRLYNGNAVDNCSGNKVSWVNDTKINDCKFDPPITNSKYITDIEFGNKFDPNADSYHCYYVETKICDTKSCSECNLDNVFNLLLSNKQFIAPTEEVGPVSSCDATIVEIPPSIINPYNPIISTIHPYYKTIINYTVKIRRSTILGDTGHALHPGRVQRTVFQKGDQIFIGTMGDGSGTLGSINEYFADEVWGDLDHKLIDELKCNPQSLPTLFLFDLSGSMSKSGMNGTPKIIEAQSSAKSTLQTIRNNNRQGINQSVGIRTFSGGCPSGGLDPRRKITQNPDFITDLNLVESYINNIGSPKGGTPLKEAVEASEDELNTYLISNSIQEGKLIILSDGEATCGKIRPNDVYAYGQTGKQVKSIRNNSISTNQSGTSGNSSLSGNQLTTKAKIKYYAVGFNVAPGSAAERDLQYLTQSTGGKYLNAQNQFELTRAFEKFSKIYVPKSNPTLSNLSSSSRLLFENSLQMIKAEEYTSALSVLEEYTSLHQKDCNGVFNLALMLEANELYNSAIQAYSSYLNLCPNSLDKEFVLNQIDLLEEDYRSFLKYNNEVVQSDLEYLNQYFQKIQNGESITLAREFIAFIKEKGSYYQNLPQTLEIESRIFKINSEEVFRGLAKCVSTINRNPHNWGRDATPILSMTYLNMERLLKSFPKGGN